MQGKKVTLSHPEIAYLKRSFYSANKFRLIVYRKNEAFEDYGEIVKGFPKWISANDRQLLKDNATVADLVVAKDGSGNFTTIMEAVNATADHSKSRIVIYIKAGAYFENVEVVKKKTNLMFIGDGIGKTVVKASRNVVDGWTTYRSATVGEFYYQ